MLTDRTEKKPHDYRIPEGRERCRPAFAEDDELKIDGRPISAVFREDRPVVSTPAPPAHSELRVHDRPRAETRPQIDIMEVLRRFGLPVLLFVVGLTLGIALGQTGGTETPQQDTTSPRVKTKELESNSAPTEESARAPRSRKTVPETDVPTTAAAQDKAAPRSQHTKGSVAD